MNKKVLIVSSTPRKNGNSDVLAEAFARGAREAGNEVEKINVRDTDLRFCIGCLYCQTHDSCVIKDGMNELYERVQHAEVLVFATPIYYYEISGQLKTFLDRLNPLYPRENKFKDVYLLATAADEDKSAMDGAIKGLQGWISCFDGVRLAGVVYGVGADKIGEIESTQAPTEAYEMGKSLNRLR